VALSEITRTPAVVEPLPAARLNPRLKQLATSVGLQALSIALLLICWLILSAIVTENVLPTPWQTWGALMRALNDGYVWTDMAITLNRTLGAFLLAMSIGLIYGSLLGSSRLFQRVFGLWLVIAASIPSLLYLVIIYLMVGLNDLAAIIGGALVVAPSVTYNVWQGMKTLDPDLSEMARVFNMPRWAIFRRVILPQTIPFIFAAARVGLALTWKIIIFVELLGRSSGVGYRIQYWYQLFNMERVLASALPFVVLMLLIELVVLRNLERYLFKWRRAEAH
jgi:NitT/TauT family transport system permease protein